MSQLAMFTALLGFGLSATILFLLQRDHLYLGHGVFWIAVAVAAAALGLWPQSIDRIAAWVGINYPPAALLLLISVVLTVKTLHNDLLNTRLERQVRLLNQQLALMEAELASQQHTQQPSRSAEGTND